MQMGESRLIYRKGPSHNWKTLLFSRRCKTCSGPNIIVWFRCKNLFWAITDLNGPDVKLVLGHNRFEWFWSIVFLHELFLDKNLSAHNIKELYDVQKKLVLGHNRIVWFRCKNLFSAITDLTGFGSSCVCMTFFWTRTCRLMIK